MYGGGAGDPKICPSFRLWEMPVYIHNATIWRDRSKAVKAQNASFGARICALGSKRCSPTFTAKLIPYLDLLGVGKLPFSS